MKTNYSFYLLTLFGILILLFGNCKKDMPNSSPHIDSIILDSVAVEPGGTINVIINASDPDGDQLSYSYEVSKGSIVGIGPNIQIIAPSEYGIYNFSVKVTDGRGGEAVGYEVFFVNSKPVITNVTLTPNVPYTSTTAILQVFAQDPDGDELYYEYNPQAGTVTGTGHLVTWNTPESEGVYTIEITVSDNKNIVKTNRIYEVIDLIIPYPPTISLIQGQNLISGDTSLTVDTFFTVKIIAQANTTSNSNIHSLYINRVFNLQTWDTTIAYNDTYFTLEITFKALSQPGVERFEFEITDNNNEKASVYFDITTEEPPEPVPINTFTMKILGSYQSETGQAFATINGNVYTMAQAFPNQAIIDFLYWWGASTFATVGAPDDVMANIVYTGPNGLPNWTVKNATRFKSTSITPNEFDAITDGAPIINAATGANQTRIGNLAINNVLAFKTVTGKHGLFKVVNINTGASGDIAIDVKVEQ